MQLTPGIHLLKHNFSINFPNGQKVPRFVYSVIVFGSDITLIDCGIKDSYLQIFDYIEQKGRKPSEISRLILSHSHPDHIGSAAKIKEITSCKVLAHFEEKEWIERIDLQCKMRPVPGFYKLLDTPVKIDEFIEHQQLIKLDENVSIRIIHSPGHSKGSINIEFIEDKILFTADSIPLKNDIPNYDNYFDLIHSLEKIKNNSNYRILISSWTEPLMERNDINRLIIEGEDYLKQIDNLVNIYYSSDSEKPFESCQKIINELNLPLFFVNPIVDKAFRTHFDNN
jgi:glyoxylase-like metal-dependent hydrolase (beta-lactamase superfamily II)